MLLNSVRILNGMSDLIKAQTPPPSLSIRSHLAIEYPPIQTAAAVGVLIERKNVLERGSVILQRVLHEILSKKMWK
jgi:hypothetical protein